MLDVLLVIVKHLTIAKVSSYQHDIYSQLLEWLLSLILCTYFLSITFVNYVFIVLDKVINHIN